MPGRFIQAHLNSNDVAQVVYGSIVGLAVVVVLERHPPTAGQTAVALAGTAVAVGLAEVYSEFVGFEVNRRRRVRGAELRAMGVDALAVAFGAIFPAIFFLVAATDALTVRTAFALAKWTGLGLICAYGYVAARMAGSDRVGAMVRAAAVGAIGGFLIALKALVH